MVDGRVDAMYAGLQGVLLIAFGAWLVPPAIRARIQPVPAGPAAAALVSRVRQLTETRTVAVDSASAELRRIERDLHDGPRHGWSRSG